jgi:hypothetical protein
LEANIRTRAKMLIVIPRRSKQLAPGLKDKALIKLRIIIVGILGVENCPRDASLCLMVNRCVQSWGNSE